MSATPSLQSKQPGSNASPWRLVNLALGFAALLSFAGASGLLPSLVPSRWIMAPWFTQSSMATVSPVAVFVARIGINLWLIASVIMILFWAAGLHRKLGAPPSKFASPVLTLAWLSNIALTAVPLMVDRGEGSGALMLVIGMFLAPVYLGLTVAVVVAATIEFSAMFRHSEPTRSHLPVELLSWAVVPPVLSVVPLLLAPSNPLALSTKETTEFTILCKEAGVRLMEKPVAPVRSIAYDWNPRHLTTRPNVDRIETDSSGRILGYGGFGNPKSAEAQKKLAFDFTESRRDGRSGLATINPDAPYYHFPDFSAKKPYYGVQSLSADVLAFLEVDNASAGKDSVKGAVRYKLTLTDRRSGAVLGVQTYVVDQVNKRACGVNIESTISQNAFIYDAINR